MKIMVVGPTDPDSFADNVAHTFEVMGHAVLRAGPARRSGGTRRVRNVLHVAADQVAPLNARLQTHVIEKARAFKPDLTITLDVRLHQEVVKSVQQGGSKAVFWFPDAVANLGKHQSLLAGYDRIYFKNPPLVEQLTSIHGLPVKYLPEAANSTWHRPEGDYGTASTIVVAGNIHPTRAILLDRLVQAGIPLSIYGPSMSAWMDFPRLRKVHSGRSVVREEKARTFRSARAVLNNLHPAEYAGSNCRLFEATACGAVVLTEWRTGMEQLFAPDSEVVPFRSFNELVEACEQLLSDPECGRPIADAAALRSSRDHTYEQRLHTILDDLALG